MNKLISYLRNIKSRIKRYFFLRSYRKDTPESTLKFYNLMRYFYRNEFKKRENFNRDLNNMTFMETLKKKALSNLI